MQELRRRSGGGLFAEFVAEPLPPCLHHLAGTASTERERAWHSRVTAV
jgi:hypothetical protein